MRVYHCKICGTETANPLSKKKMKRCFGWREGDKQFSVCKQCMKPFNHLLEKDPVPFISTDFSAQTLSRLAIEKNYAGYIEYYKKVEEAHKSCERQIETALATIKSATKRCSELKQILDFTVEKSEEHKELHYAYARARACYEVSKVKTVVFKRDNYTCKHCGASKSLTVDHIIPVLHGGSNELDNLQTLCRSCNSKKGAKYERLAQ